MKKFILFFLLSIYSGNLLAFKIKDLKPGESQNYKIDFRAGKSKEMKLLWTVKGELFLSNKGKYVWKNWAQNPLLEIKEDDLEKVPVKISLVVIGDNQEIWLKQDSSPLYRENESFYTYYNRQISEFYNLKDLLGKDQEELRSKLKSFISENLLNKLDKIVCKSLGGKNRGLCHGSFLSKGQELKIEMSFQYSQIKAAQKGLKIPKKLKELFYKNPIPGEKTVLQEWKNGNFAKKK